MATITSEPSTKVVLVEEPISTKASTSSSSTSFIMDNPLVSAMRHTYRSFSERREALGLKNPGSVENVAKEVQKSVFLNNYAFTGLRADLTKAFSVSPLFQISHNFSMGSQALPPYAFVALYGTNRVRHLISSSKGKIY